MKRKTSDIDEEQRKLSNLLFKKPKDLAEKFKSANVEDKTELDLKPAWNDDDDTEFDAKIIPNTNATGLYSETLKRKYEVLIGTPKWARLDNKTVEDDDILRTVGHLQRVKSESLKKGIIEIKKFPKITLESGKNTVKCLEFHPTASVVLAGSHVGYMALYAVGGDINNELHTFKLKNFRPSTAIFTKDGSEAFIASKSSHNYCVYNLVKAEPTLVTLPRAVRKPNLFIMSPDSKYLAVTEGYDEIYIISVSSKELIRVLKHNSEIESAVFSSESDKLYSYCKEGEIYIWDLSTFRVVKKFYDQGCVTASVITASKCGRLLATGTGEGIVNVYETADLDKSQPTPHKVIQNLRTKVTDINFNSTSEILSLTSAFYPNAVRLAHIPSYNIFSNFPQGLNLAQVEKVSFSPNSGFMAIGNNKGNAYLYRLKHYENY